MGLGRKAGRSEALGAVVLGWSWVRAWLWSMEHDERNERVEMQRFI